MLEDVSYILGLPINGETITVRSDSSHQFLVENCIAYFGREPGPQDHVLGKVNLAWVRQCRDTEPCDTQESVERYVWAHIFCVLRTVVFPNKSTTSLNSKYMGVGVLDVLVAHLVMCSTQSPLVSFGCLE
ncbi:hypothetical protein AHAS_Ahas09G0095000 [Arachis hypogaea]